MTLEERIAALEDRVRELENPDQDYHPVVRKVTAELGIRPSDIPPVDRTARVLTSGKPVPEDYSHTAINPVTKQQEAYIVLTPEERAKGFVRPVRRSYVHIGKPRGSACMGKTVMALEIAETLARDPKFYRGAFCHHCKSHFPLAEFFWKGTTEQVGS